MMKLGVRAGLAVTMCRSFSSARSAMYCTKLSIWLFLPGSGLTLGEFAMIPSGQLGAKHVIDVARNGLEFHVGNREGAHIAAGAGERHPRRWSILPFLIEHHGQVVGRILAGPIDKRRMIAARMIICIKHSVGI